MANATLNIVTFLYVNDKGACSLRTVCPVRIFFGGAAFYPSSRWLLEAFDLDKLATCEFSLAKMSGWRQRDGFLSYAPPSYPLAKRDRVDAILANLFRSADADDKDRELATTVNDLADFGRDLDDIFVSLLRSVSVPPSRLAALVSAFESTLDRIRVRSDGIGGKLRELAGRLVGDVVAEVAPEVVVDRDAKGAFQEITIRVSERPDFEGSLANLREKGYEGRFQGWVAEAHSSMWHDDSNPLGQGDTRGEAIADCRSVLAFMRDEIDASLERGENE